MRGFGFASIAAAALAVSTVVADLPPIVIKVRPESARESRVGLYGCFVSRRVTLIPS